MSMFIVLTNFDVSKVTSGRERERETYLPSSLKTAVIAWRTVLLPSSLITKLPSPIVGAAGEASLRTKNILPLLSPTATLFCCDRYRSEHTLVVSALSNI